MFAIVFGIVAICAAFVSYVNWVKTKKASKEMEKLEKDFRAIREFYEWGNSTRIVVRDRMSHEDVANVNVAELHGAFRRGDVFRAAKMLFQNNEFKVYVQGKGE